MELMLKSALLSSFALTSLKLDSMDRFYVLRVYFYYNRKDPSYMNLKFRHLALTWFEVIGKYGSLDIRALGVVG